MLALENKKGIYSLKFLVFLHRGILFVIFWYTDALLFEYIEIFSTTLPQLVFIMEHILLTY